MHAVGPSKVLRQHGTMKTNQPESVMKVSQQGCHIAVAAENLGILCDQAEIQMRQ